MKIQDVRVAHRAHRPGDFPSRQLPEFAFLGRSNVGKSSVINSLVNRRRLAQTSKTPGRTRQIHWYELTGGGRSCYFVDLPGYGYAKVSRRLRQEAWGKLIESYLRSDGPLEIAFQLLDIRRDGPTDLDLRMIDWLRECAVPHVFVLTKADKLPQGQRSRAIERFATTLDGASAPRPVPYSAVTGEGKQPLWSLIDGRLATPCHGGVSANPDE